MDDVNLATLLLSAEFDLRWGVSTATASRRTVELHEGKNILYCYEEPRGSMAKHLREKIYLDQCCVLDCGGSRSWGEGDLAIFLNSYDYAERIDLLSGRATYIFPAPAPAETTPTKRSWFSWGSSSSHVPAGQILQPQISMVLMSAPTKMMKWRFLKAIQRASSSYEQSKPAGVRESSASSAASPTGSINRFDQVVRSRHAGPQSGGASSSGTKVSRSSSVRSTTEDLVVPSTVGGAPSGGDSPPPADADRSEGIPPGLQASPLFTACIDGHMENQRCADCDSPFPTWAVLQPFGVFVCIRCIGVHRQLWANRCRSLELDLWPTEDVTFMKSRGNKAVNEELERGLLHGHVTLTNSTIKPRGRSSTADERATFIRAKYDERMFERAHDHATDGAAPLPLSTTPTQAYAMATKTVVDLDEEGPPGYCGVAHVLVKELVGPPSLRGAVLVLTNGFQELHTAGARKLLNAPQATVWDETLKIGVVSQTKPLYFSLYQSTAMTELVATAEFHLPSEVLRGGSSMVGVELRWKELHRKPTSRSTSFTPWELTLLLSFHAL